jgi:hypothetical protein
MGRIGAAAQLCDRVIVTNALLAARATESTGKEARVVRNFINLEQLEVSRRLLATKRATRYARDGHVHIGYFSGSPSHNKDFAMLKPPLHAYSTTIRVFTSGSLDSSISQTRSPASVSASSALN